MPRRSGLHRTRRRPPPRQAPPRPWNSAGIYAARHPQHGTLARVRCKDVPVRSPTPACACQRAPLAGRSFPDSARPTFAAKEVQHALDHHRDSARPVGARPGVGLHDGRMGPHPAGARHHQPDLRGAAPRRDGLTTFVLSGGREQVSGRLPKKPPPFFFRLLVTKAASASKTYRDGVLGSFCFTDRSGAKRSPCSFMRCKVASVSKERREASLASRHSLTSSKVTGVDTVG